MDKPGTGTGIEEAPAATTIFKVVEQQAEFPGGMEALYAYLGENIKFPARATEAQQSGTVRLRFVVNEDGSITNVEVVRGAGYGMDEEATRVVKKMPNWKPGKNNGKAVKSYFNLPIKFVMH